MGAKVRRPPRRAHLRCAVVGSCSRIVRQRQPRRITLLHSREGRPSFYPTAAVQHRGVLALYYAFGQSSSVRSFTLIYSVSGRQRRFGTSHSVGLGALGALGVLGQFALRLTCPPRASSYLASLDSSNLAAEFGCVNRRRWREYFGWSRLRTPIYEGSHSDGHSRFVAAMSTWRYASAISLVCNACVNLSGCPTRSHLDSRARRRFHGRPGLRWLWRQIQDLREIPEH